jgi:hypothetical protein
MTLIMLGNAGKDEMRLNHGVKRSPLVAHSSKWITPMFKMQDIRGTGLYVIQSLPHR